MDNLYLSCYVFTSATGWERLKAKGKLVTRPKPRWIPSFVWVKILNRLLSDEFNINSVGEGYIDDSSVTLEPIPDAPQSKSKPLKE